MACLTSMLLAPIGTCLYQFANASACIVEPAASSSAEAALQLDQRLLGPCRVALTQLEPTIGQRKYFELEHVSGGCESQIWAKKWQFILWMLCSVFVVALKTLQNDHLAT